MIDEKDVKYGDVFKIRDTDSHRAMFIVWDDRHHHSTGRTWIGLMIWDDGESVVRDRRGFGDNFWERA